MKKYVAICMILCCLCLCTACANGSNEQQKGSFAALKAEIDTELEAVRNGKYENLNITCDEVRLPENEEIQSLCFPVNLFASDITLSEKLNLYKDTIFPKLYDLASVDGSNVVDLHSRYNEAGKRYYKHDYAYLLKHGDELEREANIGYYHAENFQLAEVYTETVNISYGKLGRMFGSVSPFLGRDWEEIKTYNCYLDNLSDSYLLMDGEKTVAEAKAEIESYLNTQYPLIGDDNGIKNEVYEISVRKIPDTEYHIFHAYRTLSYSGIRVKEQNNGGLPSEIGVMGEVILCESNKIDLLLGFVNCFEQGTVIKTYEEFIPFTEVMERLAYYLTGDTVFNIGYMGMEYRMFQEVVDEVIYYNWVPYWSFIAENPNDDKTIRIYMNIETGEMESYEI